jgi:hypothetical protein
MIPLNAADMAFGVGHPEYTFLSATEMRLSGTCPTSAMRIVVNGYFLELLKVKL